MTQKKNFLVVNQSTYQRELILQGNTACTQRLIERVLAKIKIHMDKIINFYKSVVGFAVPLEFQSQEQSVNNYVVLFTLSQSKLPANSIRLTDESPKCIARRILVELGIS
jgi:hypothetical protein